MHGREVVSYLRVSTKLQGLDGFGIAAQREAAARFACAFSCTIVAEYAEVETGRKDNLRNRPQLVAAVGHARRSRALLVIARLDRLARSVLVTSQLLESGVEFVACDNPHANRLTIQILAAMAEHEGKLISERTKAGLAAARARGVTFGNGRRFTPEEMARGQRRAVEVRMQHTKEVYADLVPLVGEWRLAGKSLLSVAAALNELGHRTQRGNPWTSCAVTRLLKREKLPRLPGVLESRSDTATEIRRRGVVAARAAMRRKVAEVEAQALPIARSLLFNGMSLAGISRELAAHGFQNSKGGPWSIGPLLAMLRRAGLAKPHRKRVEVIPSVALRRRREHARQTCAPYIELIYELRQRGQSFEKIAETLNDCGYQPPRSDRWTRMRVYQLLLRLHQWERSAALTSKPNHVLESFENSESLR